MPKKDNRQGLKTRLQPTLTFALATLLALPFASVRAQDAPKKEFFLPKTAVGAAYYLSRLSNRELMEAPRSEFVYVALLQRKGLEKKYRVEALEGLAKIRKTDRLTELLRGMAELDKKGEASEPALRELTPLMLQAKPAELAPKRAVTEQLAEESQLPLTRQAGYAALIMGDGSADIIWSQAEPDAAKLSDLLLSVTLVPDQQIRAALHAKIEPLLHQADPAEVRRAAIAAIPAVPGHDAATFNTLAELVKGGTEITSAAASLQKIPRAAWPAEQAGPLVASLTAYLQKLPVAQRAAPEGLSIFQLATDLTALLPPEKKATAAKTLRALGVNVFIIRTIPEQMLFDKSLLVVEAGKPVQLILVNDDTMPHNLVILQPDTLERVGALADKMGPEADTEGRLYVPDVPEVFRATKLVEAGQQEKLSFNAPRTPGEYNFVCTFPGHWRRMVGTFAVVKDVEAYLASHSAPKITEWKLADLTADLPNAGSGRNGPRGRELFTKLACATCHKLGAEGVNFGPDLTDVFKRFNQDRAEVLRHILEPSLVISNRYQNVMLDLTNDDTAVGLLVKEDAAGVTLQSGPSDALIKTFKKSEIAARRASAISLMPVGILNALSKEEIFDLLAFLEGGGDGPRNTHKH